MGSLGHLAQVCRQSIVLPTRPAALLPGLPTVPALRYWWHQTWVLEKRLETETPGNQR